LLACLAAYCQSINQSIGQSVSPKFLTDLSNTNYSLTTANFTKDRLKMESVLRPMALCDRIGDSAYLCICRYMCSLLSGSVRIDIGNILIFRKYC